MTESVRPAPFFLADDRALDFLNTVAAPWGSDIEWIADGADLLDWLELAGLVPPSVAKRFRADVSREALDAVTVRARELRQWFRGFVTARAGRPLPKSALDHLGVINGLLAKDDTYRQLVLTDSAETNKGQRDGVFTWQHQRRWHSPDSLLVPIAETIGGLVCRADFARVRMCQWPPCTMWFLDVSQNRKRRWCSMAVCGNRAKAAAHRARKKRPRQ